MKTGLGTGIAPEGGLEIFDGGYSYPAMSVGRSVREITHLIMAQINKHHTPSYPSQTSREIRPSKAMTEVNTA